MKLILGLGNPGARYRNTRHNVGFDVVDRLIEHEAVTAGPSRDVDRKIRLCEARHGGHEFVLAKPLTYMNRSGRAAVSLLEAFDAEPPELLVVYDDADLPLGRLRLRKDGGAGGHNGIRSLLDALHRRDFPRLRLGVRGEQRDEEDLADYVLREFDDDEQGPARAMIELAGEAVLTAARDGIDHAMNRFNGCSVEPPEATDTREH